MWLIDNSTGQRQSSLEQECYDNTRRLLQYTCLLESSMANGTVNNTKNQFLTLEFTIVFNLCVHNCHYVYV